MFFLLLATYEGVMILNDPSRRTGEMAIFYAAVAIIAWFLSSQSDKKIERPGVEKFEKMLLDEIDSRGKTTITKEKKSRESYVQERKRSLKQTIQKGLTTLEDMYQDALKAKLSKDLISTLDSDYQYRVESIKDYKNGNIDTKVAKEMIQFAIDEFKVEVRNIVLQPKIIAFLKKEKTKLPASDIAFQLKIADLKLVKKICEELYIYKKIGRTSNYRYFATPSKKKSKQSADNIDTKAELKKLKSLLDEGLITKEQYELKSNKLLGI